MEWHFNKYLELRQWLCYWVIGRSQKNLEAHDRKGEVALKRQSVEIQTLKVTLARVWKAVRVWERKLPAPWRTHAIANRILREM